jgi:hypothetical protein
MGTRSVAEDSALISEGFCPNDREKLKTDGWCASCQIYYGTRIGAGGGPMVTRSNNRDYINSFHRELGSRQAPGRPT